MKNTQFPAAAGVEEPYLAVAIAGSKVRWSDDPNVSPRGLRGKWLTDFIVVSAQLKRDGWVLCVNPSKGYLFARREYLVRLEEGPYYESLPSSAF